MIRIKLPVVLLVVLAACGPTARQRTLRATLAGLNAARDGFVAWDAEHQRMIVDQALSLEEGRAALDAYRDRREPVVVGFELAYRTLAVASLEASAESLVAALSNARRIYQLLTDIKRGGP